MSEAKHTPGPWRWELSKSSKHLSLVGGDPEYDLTILEPTRWGMQSATLMIRDTAHDGMNIMHRLDERPDWIAPFPGREHHARWCSGVIHPDMRLIEAAPDLLEAAQAAYAALLGLTHRNEIIQAALDKSHAALIKATGGVQS